MQGSAYQYDECISLVRGRLHPAGFQPSIAKNPQSRQFERGRLFECLSFAGLVVVYNDDNSCGFTSAWVAKGYCLLALLVVEDVLML